MTAPARTWSSTPLAVSVDLDALHVVVDPRVCPFLGAELTWDYTRWRVHTIAHTRHAGWPAIYFAAEPI